MSVPGMGALPSVNSSSSAAASMDGGNLSNGATTFGEGSVHFGGDGSIKVVGIIAATVLIGLYLWKR